MTGDTDLIGLDRFSLATDPEKEVASFEFYNGDKWVPLTKQISKFFAPKP